MNISDNVIVHFCDVTGANPDQARTFIQLSDGNVEMAIGLYLESGGGAGMDLGADTHMGDASPPVQESPPRNIVDLTNDDVVQSANNTRAPVNDDFNPMDHQGDFTRPLIPHVADRMVNIPYGVTEMRVPEGYHQTSDAFLRSSSTAEGEENRLARLFAPPRDLMFSEGDFEQAREYARSNDRWLLVTLHDPKEFPCQVLNRDLWKDESVKEIVKSSFIFLQYVVGTPEGQKYRNFYPVETLPHIAIIDPRTGERVKVWLHGPAPSEFMVDAMDFLETHSLNARSQKSISKKPKSDLDSMSEEAQLAAAICQSLEESNPKKKDYSSSSNPVQNLSPAERAEIPQGTPDSTSIQFRLPDGKRVVRKFLKSDLVSVLFQHIKFAVSELQETPFELMYHRDVLSKSLDKTLDEMKLTGVALNVDYL